MALATLTIVMICCIGVLVLGAGVNTANNAYNASQEHNTTNEVNIELPEHHDELFSSIPLDAEGMRQRM